MVTFTEWPKIARLSREMIITEKIDGTNAQVEIFQRAAEETPDGPRWDSRYVIDEIDGMVMLAGSRTRYITPEDDNHGFAKWVKANAKDLMRLGPGRHYGEWWGSGIQRAYGKKNGEKVFSLFNVGRWADNRDLVKYPIPRPECCNVVPVLYRGLFDTKVVDDVLAKLQLTGSDAAPGFMNPEGIIVYHVAAGISFKKTIEKDAEPKGKNR